MKEYTILAIISVLITIIIDRRSGICILQRKIFYPFFAIIIGFKLLVNGALTGREVVCYDPTFFLGIRIGSIPLEDFLFGFSMVTLTIIFWEYFKQPKKLIMLILSVSLLSLSTPGYALDWKQAHETYRATTLAAAQEAVKNDPASLDALYTLGLVYLAAHNTTEAADIFATILRIDPTNIPARWGTADMLRRTHALTESETLLTGIIAAEPTFFPAYISLGYIRYLQLRFDDAVRLAVQVVRAADRADRDSHMRAHLLIGGTKGMIAHYGGPLSKMLNGRSIFPHLHAAEKIMPADAEVQFGLGSFYLLAPAIVGGDITKAESYLTAAITTDPFLVDAYVRLAQLYQKKGEGARFEEYLKKALTLDPKSELAVDISTGSCRFICLPRLGTDE